MARLRSILPDAQLAVAGSGDAAPYINLARSLGIAHQIAFLGRVATVEDAYAAADVAIQPTHYDACSLATLEGLACALPTLTTSTNGAGELITSGVEGFVLQHAGDDQSLAAAMAKLHDPALRDRMGVAARKLALAHDLNTNHCRVETFYRQRLKLAAPANPLPAK
jgi:glycosyltransferase involved in cell wall biosynthesis